MSPTNSAGRPGIVIARMVAAVALGFLAFASGLTYIVMRLFIEPVLPAGPVWLIVVLVSLAAFGVVLGGLVRVIAGQDSRVPARISAGLATGLMVGNIVLNVATEPLWFKLCVIGIVAPAIITSERYLAGVRSGRAAGRAGHSGS